MDPTSADGDDGVPVAVLVDPLASTSPSLLFGPFDDGEEDDEDVDCEKEATEALLTGTLPLPPERASVFPPPPALSYPV
jgi:hypothetical protein